ncbi:NHLP leader peptide family RiPP precursor [Leptolyngbya boryana CZ1]|uniref:NHLP leader peptide family RiPP n=1 Tax=Leptolyngbya boryana CZ1 TaxID=3060204 RepID=A0AA97AU54_LEPBY|nr:NHLP leader peptide family RiPP precursor [Leptolyngbya boryana]WNZ43916.1 NHLP leader peptide family RiPP precursor [Leptolyngbya boryana CZ1]
MSTDPNSGRMSEIEAQLISQAMQDAGFRDRLLTNPKTVLAEQGLNIPDTVQIQVMQETTTQFYLVLPASESTPPPDGSAISEQELEAIAGGVDTTNTSWTGCASGRSGCIVSTNCQARDYPGTW